MGVLLRLEDGVSSEPGCQKKEGGRYWPGTHSSHKAGAGGWAVMREVWLLRCGYGPSDLQESPVLPKRALTLVGSDVLGWVHCPSDP